MRIALPETRRSMPGTMDRVASQRKNFLNTLQKEALIGGRNAAAHDCQQLSDAGFVNQAGLLKGENNAFE